MTIKSLKLILLSILLVGRSSMFSSAEPTYTETYKTLYDDFGRRSSEYIHAYQDFNHTVYGASVTAMYNGNNENELEFEDEMPCELWPNYLEVHYAGWVDTWEVDDEAIIIEAKVFDDYLIIFLENLKAVVVELFPIEDESERSDDSDDDQSDMSDDDQEEFIWEPEFHLDFSVIHVVDPPVDSLEYDNIEVFFSEEGNFAQIFTYDSIFEYVIDGENVYYTQSYSAGSDHVDTWIRHVQRGNKLYVLSSVADTTLSVYQLAVNSAPQLLGTIQTDISMEDFDLYNEEILAIINKDNGISIFELNDMAATLKKSMGPFSASKIAIEEYMFAFIIPSEEDGEFQIVEYVRPDTEGYSYVKNREEIIDKAFVSNFFSDERFLYLKEDGEEGIFYHSVPNEIHDTFTELAPISHGFDGKMRVEYLESLYGDPSTPFIFDLGEDEIEIKMIYKVFPTLYCDVEMLQEMEELDKVSSFIIEGRFQTMNCPEKEEQDDENFQNYCEYLHYFELERSRRGSREKSDLLWLLVLPLLAVLVLAVCCIMRKLKQQQKRNDNMKHHFKKLKQQLGNVAKDNHQNNQINELNNKFVQFDDKLDNEDDDFFDRDPVALKDINLGEKKMSADQQKQINNIKLDEE